MFTANDFARHILGVPIEVHTIKNSEAGKTADKVLRAKNFRETIAGGDDSFIDLSIQVVMAVAEFTNQFSQEWLCAWNNHDLEAILSHYADDFEMISPYIVTIAGDPSGTLYGKKEIG